MTNEFVEKHVLNIYIICEYSRMYVIRRGAKKWPLSVYQGAQGKLTVAKILQSQCRATNNLEYLVKTKTLVINVHAMISHATYAKLKTLKPEI